MSKSNRSDTRHGCRSDRACAAGGWRFSALALALVLAVIPGIEAKPGNAQRAIEDLEGCSGKERAAGNCINILKRESAGKSKQRIKAQVRGGRIIWYEFDSKSGRVRRAN